MALLEDIATGDLAAVTQLAAAFDDATLRRDAELFESLWLDDAVWEIGQPLPLHVQGRPQVVETWKRMVADVPCFFRATYAGLVVPGDSGPGELIGRWPSVEIGTRRDGRGYLNYATYHDTYGRDADGRWRFSARRYHYAYLDSSPLAGTAVGDTAAQAMD